jgi:putative membrane protein
MLVPLGAIMAVFGFGVMLPDTLGGIVIGALPLIFGLFILSKGLGIEATVGRIAQEMRENADAAMFSSLLWTSTVFSAIFAVATGYDRDIELNAAANYSVVWIGVVQAALAWIVIAFLTSTAGFMLLRLQKGSFSGRLIVLAVFGMVVYSFLDQGLQIAMDVLEGKDYQFTVQGIWDVMLEPLMWIAVLWVTTTIVRAVQARQAQSERYWGI